MRVAFVSDIHLNVNRGLKVVDALIDICNKQSIDFLIIAGDIASNFDDVIIFLNDFKQRSKTAIKFVPGNHDIYIHKDYKSNEIYDLLRNLEECLIEKPLIINNTVIIGETMHYDYSFKIERFNNEEQKRKRYRGTKWADLKYLKWKNFSDEELNEFFINRLRVQLENFKNKRIICVTHTVPFKSFIKYSGESAHDYFSAYIGSKKIGELLLGYENVEIAIFGHTHYRKEMNIEHIYAFVPALGYYFEWDYPNDSAKELENVIKIIEVE